MARDRFSRRAGLVARHGDDFKFGACRWNNQRLGRWQARYYRGGKCVTGSFDTRGAAPPSRGDPPRRPRKAACGDRSRGAPGAARAIS